MWIYKYQEAPPFLDTLKNGLIVVEAHAIPTNLNRRQSLRPVPNPLQTNLPQSYLFEMIPRHLQARDGGDFLREREHRQLNRTYQPIVRGLREHIREMSLRGECT